MSRTQKLLSCCQALEGLGPFSSPFDAKVVLDYCDGEVEGLLRCGDCGRYYAFRLVDVGQDRERAYCLGQISKEDFEKCVRALEHLAASNEVISPREESMRAQLDRVVEDARAERIVAWRIGVDGILAARRVPGGGDRVESFDVQEWRAERDWFVFLYEAQRGTNDPDTETPKCRT